MLTTAMKHQMIIQYNEERKQKQDEEVEKKKTKANFRLPSDGSDGQEVRKLHKLLCDDHQNKDVRREIKNKLGERPENQISPSMWVSLNPAYSMESHDKASVMRDTFQGKQEEAVDKVYFRRRDEHSQYAEFLFKSKVVLTKK